MDDEYPTCARTYATLCIHPNGIDPVEITRRLGLDPSSWQRRGALSSRTDGGPPRLATIDGWFLATKDRVDSRDSRDSRRHRDWLLDHLEAKDDVARRLQELGCRMCVWCYWLSQEGQGGPILPAAQMRSLADLNLELRFDFYGPIEDDLDLAES
ncbi:DUF4279 domain-containing protein [Planctomyces sp. SH-PL62]|uniref:DUF4279 domain-containing protein n=1 Tax=Planctomyces sp. SH-PL62 TaxID=1636152 RepID=UPI00078C4749|nr:DUF4279 domain-containing protein [Planctomyces sp. SH-PL62]AMV38352.1 hypothetical protein VT85_13020 [Planctomyces sp. SH-PL62]